MATAFPSTARTVPDLLRDAVQALPDQDAYVELNRRLTYAELDRAADGLATLWASWGLARGDVVCLAIPSSIDYAIAYHAAMRLGAITSGVNPRLGAPEKLSIVSRLQPTITVIGDDPLPADAPTGRELPITELSAAYALDPDYRRPELSADDVVTVVWTSGTTDMPKGAVYDHARLAAMAAGAGAMSRPFDRRIYPLPFAHTGYMTRVWDEVCNGMACIVTPVRWTVDDSMLLMERERVTVGQGVATQWELMMRNPRFDEMDFSAMRIAMMGASHIPSSLVRQVRERLGVPVVVRYTSTEACLTTGTDPGDPVEVVANTVGKPLPGVEVELVDGDGNRVPDGAIGQIRCRSAAMMKGYWRDPELTAQTFTADGWLKMGDLGYFDEDGNLHVTGRVKDMYIRGGYNVYPVQVEEVLRGHPAVADVAVVGVPDDVLGEIGHAFVVTRGGQPPTLAELREFAVGRLSDYKAPDRLTVIDELPRNAMGKVDRRRLLAGGELPVAVETGR